MAWIEELRLHGRRMSARTRVRLPRTMGAVLSVMVLAQQAAGQQMSTPPARLTADSGSPSRQKLKLLLQASPQRAHVFLTWSERPHADYKVRWRAEKDTSWHERTIKTANFAAISPLKNGVRYEFQVITVGESAGFSSDIVSAVPRIRDDCHSTLNVFCSVPDLIAFARLANLDLRLLRCGRLPVREFDINSPNCRYAINEQALTLNRAFGGFLQAPERLPDPESVRQALRSVVWGSDDPLLHPGSLLSQWQDVRPAMSGSVDISDSLEHEAVGRDARTHVPIVRSLVMHVHGSMLSRLTWFAYPDHIPGRYAIYNEGHGVPGIGSAAPMINWLLRAGWQVLVLDMPLDGLNAPDARYPLFGHDDLDFLARAEGASALRWFFLPVAASVDLVYDDAHTRKSGVDLLMLGRSGGGWMSMLYSAMDTRVAVAANISGGAPLSIYLDSSVFRPLGSHYENETATLYDQVSSTDFLLTAGTKGNFHFFSTHDPCCYRFSASHPWIRVLQSLKSRREKKYRVFVDDRNDIHGLSTLGMATLGKFLEEVGLPSRATRLTPAENRKQASDSLPTKSRTPQVKPPNDSTIRRPPH